MCFGEHLGYAISCPFLFAQNTLYKISIYFGIKILFFNAFIMKNIKHYFKGFTLVELIIVITILTILATIAFISFQNYSWDARDANRIFTLKNIETWLELFTLKTSTFPTPDEVKTYTWWLEWKSQLNQWIIWESIAKIISMNTVPLDPKEKTHYIYSTFWKNNKYYQIWIDSENNELSFISQVYAKSKSSIVRWNYRFDPSLPSLIVVENEALTNSWIFSPEVCFVMNNWKNTIHNCNEIKENMNLNNYDNSLVWYWDMESKTNDWKLKDLSWYGNHGEWSWGVIIWWEIGTIWKATILTWWLQYFKIENNPSIDLDTYFTFSAIYTYSKSFSGAWNNPIFNKPFPWWHVNPYYQYHFWIVSPNYLISPINNPIWYNKCWFDSKFWSWIVVKEASYIAEDCFLNKTTIYITSTFDWKTNNMYINWIKIKKYNWDWRKYYTLWDWKLNLDIFPITKYNTPLYIWVYWNLIPNWELYTLKWTLDELKIYNRALTPEEVFQQSKIAWF